jgi:hypothetical protein
MGEVYKVTSTADVLKLKELLESFVVQYSDKNKQFDEVGMNLEILLKVNNTSIMNISVYPLQINRKNFTIIEGGSFIRKFQHEMRLIDDCFNGYEPY